jgi:hypothetical protein
MYPRARLDNVAHLSRLKNKSSIFKLRLHFASSKEPPSHPSAKILNHEVVTANSQIAPLPRTTTIAFTSR